jgi:hypothetical protein
LKKLAYLGGVAAALSAAFWVEGGHAADHVDAPALAQNPLADLNDVYVWSDGAKVNLAMTTSPGDDGMRAFGPGVQYVFHVTSKATQANDAPPVAINGGAETQIICTFASSTSARCWVKDVAGVKDYVEGDPSSANGISSVSGKVRLFAGRRSDPFFFNLQGFRDAVTAVENTPEATRGLDAAGCPAGLTETQIAAVRDERVKTPAQAQAPCPPGVRDCFGGLNVLAIVVQVDKGLVNTPDNKYIAVWGSTHAGS